MDTKGLDKFIAAFKTAPKIKIGILSAGRRHDSDLTNADIGAKHEFGDEGVPMRSFLRVPISDHLAKFIEKSDMFDKDVLSKVVAERDLKPWMEKLAILSQSVVMEAFASEGFGKWPQWQTPGYNNKTGMLLQDTLQLRDSITYEIVDS